MEQFSLEKYLENPSRKVVTRDGREAIIVCTNADDKFPVVAKIQGWDAPFVELFNKDGIHSLDWNGCIFDLFFADEEEELTEFEKELEMMMVSFSNGKLGSDVIKEMPKQKLHNYANRLLDLARKEILKDLPKWKKAEKDEELDCHVAIQQDDRVVLSDFVQKDEYYITLDVLKKLPKEE